MTGSESRSPGQRHVDGRLFGSACQSGESWFWYVLAEVVWARSLRRCGAGLAAGNAQVPHSGCGPPFTRAEKTIQTWILQPSPLTPWDLDEGVNPQ